MKSVYENQHFDAVVVGAGFAGAVAARELAELGKQVLLLERRKHIGGNAYDAKNSDGVLVHKYGPHLFHTGNIRVWDYLQQFSSWHSYEHRVLGSISGKLVPIPFNFASIDRLFPADAAASLKDKLLSEYQGKDRVSVLALKNCSDQQLRELGEFVYENIFAHYTAKQWGIPAEQVDSSVLERVPVVLGYDNRYFKDVIQMMPQNGFASLFEKLLDHSNITLLTGTSALDVIHMGKNGKIMLHNEPFTGPVVYTGAIDELMNYKYGELPYRSLLLQFETQKKTEFQPAGVVNYPNEYSFTRITEFKKLTGQILDGTTTILYEFPISYEHKSEQEPYYPIENDLNRALYKRYLADAKQYENLFLCGRLAEYKYYNMDAVVDRALCLIKEISKKLLV